MANLKNLVPPKTRKKRLGIALLLSIFLSSIPGYGKHQKPPKSPDLNWYSSGSSSIQERFGENFYKVMDRLETEENDLNTFLYAIAEMPLSKEQIIKKTRLTEEQVSNLISSLSSIKLIRTFGQDMWATTIPIITDNHMKQIRESLFTMAENTAKYLKAESSNLRDLYNRAKTPQDPRWKDMTHLFFSKLIIDATFHRNMNILNSKRKRRESEGIAQSGSSLFFFEIGSNYTSLGCNWYVFKNNGKQREIYFLHGNVYNRYEFPMEKYRRSKEFSAAYFKIPTGGRIEGLAENEKTMFQKLGWIDNNKVLIPIVKNTSVKAMIPAFQNSGKNAAEIAFGDFKDIIDLYEKSPHSKFLEGSKDYIQVCLHSLFGMVAERLIVHGVLPEIPDTLPEIFGIYFVFGKLY